MRKRTIDYGTARRLYGSGKFRSRLAVAEYMGCSVHAVRSATLHMKRGKPAIAPSLFQSRAELYQRGYDMVVRERLSFNKAAERIGVSRSGIARAFGDTYAYLKINRWAHGILGEDATYEDIWRGITDHDLRTLYRTNLFSQVDLADHLRAGGSRRFRTPLAGIRPRHARIRAHRAKIYCPDSPIMECCQCVLRTGECCWETGHKPFLEVTDELGIEVLLR